MTTTTPSPEAIQAAERVFSRICDEDHRDLAASQRIADIARIMDAAIAQARAQALEDAAVMAEHPYGDEVRALGPDEPLAVGIKIAAAIRNLIGKDQP